MRPMSSEEAKTKYCIIFDRMCHGADCMGWMPEMKPDREMPIGVPITAENQPQYLPTGNGYCGVPRMMGRG